MMINENLKRARKAKKISQEEMAVRLNVVRQTISKWENGLSVPDADMLIKIAELLEVSVSSLLGVNIQCEPETTLADQLAQINEELAEQKRKNSLMLQAEKKRGSILFLSVLAMLISLRVNNEMVSVVLAGACLISALVLLYRNQTLLTSVSTAEFQAGGSGTGASNHGVLKITTIFNIILLLFIMAVLILDKKTGLSFMKLGGKTVETGVISAIMLFGGLVSPRLPFNRYTGLRLPWTIRDEDTWNLAHRVLGFISLPFVILYLAAVCTIRNFEVVSGTAVLLWIGIPGIISGIFFLRKFRSR